MSEGLRAPFSFPCSLFFNLLISLFVALFFLHRFVADTYHQKGGKEKATDEYINRTYIKKRHVWGKKHSVGQLYYHHLSFQHVGFLLIRREVILYCCSCYRCRRLAH